MKEQEERHFGNAGEVRVARGDQREIYSKIVETCRPPVRGGFLYMFDTIVDLMAMMRHKCQFLVAIRTALYEPLPCAPLLKLL